MKFVCAYMYEHSLFDTEQSGSAVIVVVSKRACIEH